MIYFYDTFESWREQVIAEMFNAFPAKQKIALFDPDREYNKLNYWTSWLEMACIHWRDPEVTKLFNKF
jgi:hypothetical protein